MPSPAAPFSPLTPEQLAEHRARRAAGEAEIARREAELAEAEARLETSRADVAALEAELDALSRPTHED
jgi:chromosome segregation ATPase